MATTLAKNIITNISGENISFQLNNPFQSLINQLADKIYLKEDIGSLFSLKEDIQEFLNIICKDRDETHATEHMILVLKLSCGFYIEYLNRIGKKIEDEIPNFVILYLTAGLHDVMDHKYMSNDDYEKYKIIVKDFISQMLLKYYKGNILDGDVNKLSNKIIEMMDNVSFSKENKYRKENPGKIPPFDIKFSEFIPLFFYVSDADKITALDLSRCVEFTKELFSRKFSSKTTTTSVSQEEINNMFKQFSVKNVIKHCEEKLLRLYPEIFIKTDEGRKFGKIFHEKLIYDFKIFNQ